MSIKRWYCIDTQDSPDYDKHNLSRQNLDNNISKTIVKILYESKVNF
jgi:hypothetical protein